MEQYIVVSAIAKCYGHNHFGEGGLNATLFRVDLLKTMGFQ